MKTELVEGVSRMMASLPVVQKGGDKSVVSVEEENLPIEEPDEELPDMIYVDQGLWQLLRNQIEKLLANPPKESIGELGRLLKHAEKMQELLAMRLEINMAGGKSVEHSGNYVEVTEKKAKIHLSGLLNFNNNRDLQTFHKGLEQKAQQ